MLKIALKQNYPMTLCSRQFERNYRSMLLQRKKIKMLNFTEKPSKVKPLERQIKKQKVVKVEHNLNDCLNDWQFMKVCHDIEDCSITNKTCKISQRRIEKIFGFIFSKLFKKLYADCNVFLS